MATLINVLPGSDFFQNVINHFNNNNIDINDYTFIFPTGRLKKIYFEKLYQNKKNFGIKFPETIVISQLDMGYFLFNLDFNENIKDSVDKNYRTFWLADAVKDFFLVNGEEKSYKDIYEYAVKIGEIFDDALKYEVDFEILKDAVKNADLALNWQKTSAFLTIIYNEWQQHLTNIDMFDVVEKQIEYSKNFAKIIKNNCKKFVYVGFTGNIIGDKYILNALKNCNNSIVFTYCSDFSYNEKELSDIKANITHPLNSIYSNINVDDFENKIEYGDDLEKAKFLKYMFYPSNHTIKWNRDEISPLNNVHTIETKNDEAGIISLIVREALETKNTKIGIVTPDRLLADKIKSILQIWNIECDDSVAQNLFDNEEGIFIRLVIDVIKNNFSKLSFLSLIKNKYFNLGKNKLYTKRITGLIEINFFKKLNINPNYSNINYLKSLTKEEAEDIANSVKMSLDDFNECVDFIDEIIAIFYKYRINANEKYNVLLFCENIKNICNNIAPMQKEDEIINPLDFGVMMEKIENLKSYNDILPKFDLDEFNEILKVIFTNIRIENQSILSDRVYIFGTIEASMQHFDKLIICSMNEGLIPKVVNHSIWMPNKLSEEIGFATIEQIIGMTGYDLMTMFSSKTIYLIRAVEEKGVETTPSRWLERFNILTEIQNNKKNIKLEKNYYYQNILNELNQSHNFKPCDPPTPMVEKKYMPKSLGVTDVAKLIKDPYQIYVKNILKLRKLDDIKDGVDSKQYGIILHKIYERIQLEILKQKENFDFDKMGVKIMKEEFLKSYDLNYFSKIILPQLIKHKKFIIELANRNTTMQKFEQEYKAKFEYGGNELVIFAKIDRLEFNFDELTVIDFKSSNKNVPEPDKNPQLLITALILQKNILNANVKQVGLYSFNAINKESDLSKILTLVDVEKEINDDENNSSNLDTKITYIKKMEETLKTVIINQLSDNAIFSVNNVEDEFNDYNHFSRIKEWNKN